jgi:hypothetical protein
MDWSVRVRFQPVQDFSLLQGVQSGSGAHSTSYPIRTGGGDLSLGLMWPGREADHYFHLVPRSRMVELYLPFTLCLHGTELNLLSKGTTLPFNVGVLFVCLFV